MQEGEPMSDRREFLKKLAKGAVYAAPVMHSIAAPVDLLGQGQSSQHKHQSTTTATPPPGPSAFPPPPGSQTP